MIRSTLATFTKQTIGRVLRRTSTKHRSIAFELLDHRRISVLPASSKATKRPLGLAPTLRSIDRLGVGFHRVVVALAHALQNVPHLMHPGALMLHLRIDGGSSLKVVSM